MQQDNQILKMRKEKLQKLRELGVDPYPTTSNRTHKIIQLLDNEKEYAEKEQRVSICGRIFTMRRQGKIGFAKISDDSGKIQAFVRSDNVGADNYEIFKLCDASDFVQIDGTCFYTQTGEYSVNAEKVTLLSKNMRPIPAVKEKVEDGKVIRYDEFADIELRYRKRYLDLLLNPENKKVFETRSKIIRLIRNWLENKGFLEVETPILQPLYGGANARPFTTHHNTLDMDLYLRIATELYLKRLIVGGFERVFEIGKNFRNEGMDRSHNPEFTLMELYQAFSDLDGMIDLTQNLMHDVALEVLGTVKFDFNGQEIDFSLPWRAVPMTELIKEHTGFDASDFNYDKIKGFCKQHKIEVDPHAGPGKLITEIFDHFVEGKLIQPTFVTDFPTEVSPLAKKNPKNPQLTERFELFINGCEYANAFTELNDPLDQRERLEDQAKKRELGDLEANVVDEDFLEALEYGMPPMGGLGIGIDRFIMLLTNNTSIKEIIFFPQMKPE